MQFQLHNLLEKLGLRFEDLTTQEREVYEQWNRVLSAPQITIEDLKKFIPVQLEYLELEQNKYDNERDKDLFLKAAIRNLKMIHAFILGPEQRREWLSKHIDQKSKQLSK